jgi:2-polyprenyl-6-methoxyphenol hydroxylase-like FAD-dependent oxidoreductase
MGDAAHTMPPDVGQGVSCAAEDAVVYALLLKHYLASSPDQALVLTAKAYEDIRKPHIHRILDIAKRNGDSKKEKSRLGEIIRDFVMKIVCEFVSLLSEGTVVFTFNKGKLPESLNDAVFAYDPEAVVTAYLRPKPRSRLW